MLRFALRRHVDHTGSNSFDTTPAFVGFLDVVRQWGADHYGRIDRIPTAKDAATSLFVPKLDRLYLAVPAQNNQPAELRILRPRAAASAP